MLIIEFVEQLQFPNRVDQECDLLTDDVFFVFTQPYLLPDIIKLGHQNFFNLINDIHY